MKKKGNKKKNSLIIGLFAVIFLMAVGYAVYSSDLIINATGHILSDWDVQFNEVELNVASGGSTLKEDSADVGGAEAILEPLTAITADGLTLTLGGALTYFDDKIVYDVDIRNYSEMFGAEIVSIDIEYFSDSAMTTELVAANRFIEWSVTGLTLPVDTPAAPGTIILKDTSLDNSGTSQAIKVIATWDATQKAAEKVPDDAKKTIADAGHVEYAKITLKFQAADN